MAKKKQKVVIDMDAFIWADKDTSETEKIVVEEKKALKSFFEDDGEKHQDVKKDKSVKKISKRKLKKQEQQRKNREKALKQAKNQKVFKYRKKKYKTVEDFIKFLNDHYLELDLIAEEILEDKLFLGWLKRKSGVFDQSLKDFKKVQSIIEKK